MAEFPEPRPTPADAEQRIRHPRPGRWAHPDPAGTCVMRKRRHATRDAALVCEFDSQLTAWMRREVAWQEADRT